VPVRSRPLPAYRLNGRKSHGRKPLRHKPNLILVMESLGVKNGRHLLELLTSKAHSLSIRADVDHTHGTLAPRSNP
jgi:hypothetical protein